MAGIPVVIVSSGGFPVTPVDSNAPAMESVENYGVPITLTSNGAPFVVSGFNPVPPGPLGPLDYANSAMDTFTNFSRTYDLAADSAILGLVCHYDGDPVITIEHGGEPLTIVRIDKADGMLSLIAAGTGLTVESAQLTVTATGGGLHGGAIRINEVVNVQPAISGWVEGGTIKGRTLTLPASTGTDGGVIKVALGSSAYAPRAQPKLSGANTVWSGYVSTGPSPDVDLSPSAPWVLGSGWSWVGSKLVHTGAARTVAELRFAKVGSRASGGGANHVTIADGALCNVSVYDSGNAIRGPFEGPMFNSVSGGIEFLRIAASGDVEVEDLSLSIDGIGVTWIFGSVPAEDGIVLSCTSTATGPVMAMSAAEILGEDY